MVNCLAVWTWCLRCCMASACSLDRRKKQRTIYKAILSARITIETREKRSGNPVDSKKNKNGVISGRTVDVRVMQDLCTCVCVCLLFTIPLPSRTAALSTSPYMTVSCPQPLRVILGQPFLLLPTPPCSSHV